MLNITADGKLEEILEEHTLVFVDFHAEWCGPCKAIAPYLEEAAKEYTDIFFCKVDVDEAEETAANYKIQAMPTFKLIKNKEVVQTIMGANKAAVEAALKEFK